MGGWLNFTQSWSCPLCIRTLCSCQYTAFGWNSRAQQLEPVQAKRPQVSEEVQGRWWRMAGLSEALEERHPPDRGWGKGASSTASAANLSWVIGCAANSSPCFTFNRDVRHRDPVVLLLPALLGHAKLDHLPAHVQLRHAAHHCCPARHG